MILGSVPALSGIGEMMKITRGMASEVKLYWVVQGSTFRAEKAHTAHNFD